MIKFIKKTRTCLNQIASQQSALMNSSVSLRKNDSLLSCIGVRGRLYSHRYNVLILTV